MNKCKNCGYAFDGKFCPECGKPREEEESISAKPQTIESSVGDLEYTPLEASIIKDGVKKAWGYSSKNECMINRILMVVGWALGAVALILLIKAILAADEWSDSDTVTKLLNFENFKSNMTLYLVFITLCYFLEDVFTSFQGHYERNKIIEWLNCNNIDSVKLINNGVRSKTKTDITLESKRFLYYACQENSRKRFNKTFIINCCIGTVCALISGMLLYFAILDFSETEIIMGTINKTKGLVLIICAVAVATVGILSKDILSKKLVSIKEKEIDEWAKYQADC